MFEPVRLIFVGGFLGAGKTTLMLQCAQHLTAKGLRVGLITNDKAPDLVDTNLLQSHGIRVGEVAGNCFSCNFRGLIDAAMSVQSDAPADVLIAEPLGSCVDLSATVLQPLKHLYRNEFIVSPFTVLTDPQRVREVLSGTGDSLHADVAYIFHKQLEEADIIAVNKIDTLSEIEQASLMQLIQDEYPQIEVMRFSGRDGSGVEPWLDDMMHRNDAGRRIAEVNYDTYANGEAVLGWINSRVGLNAREPIDWSIYAGQLLRSLGAEFIHRRADVGHVKLWLHSGDHQLTANLTRTIGQPTIRTERAPHAARAQLVLNARVEMAPATLEGIVRDVLSKTQANLVTANIDQMRCRKPCRPRPTHRYADVVAAA